MFDPLLKIVKLESASRILLLEISKLVKVGLISVLFERVSVPVNVASEQSKLGMVMILV